MKQTRRKFLQSLGLLYGSVVCLPSCIKQYTDYHVFTSAEAETLIALCEQIIPADHDPGATDAGVIWFIDKLLYERFLDLLPVYQQGLKGLESSSRELYQASFTALAPEQQVDLMKKNGSRPASRCLLDRSESLRFL